jgi:hypothetical protein
MTKSREELIDYMMECIKAFTDAYFLPNVQLIDLVHSDEIKELSVI